MTAQIWRLSHSSSADFCSPNFSSCACLCLNASREIEFPASMERMRWDRSTAVRLLSPTRSDSESARLFPRGAAWMPGLQCQRSSWLDYIRNGKMAQGEDCGQTGHLPLPFFFPAPSRRCSSPQSLRTSPIHSSTKVLAAQSSHWRMRCWLRAGNLVMMSCCSVRSSSMW